MAWVEPLEMQTWFVNVFSGSTDIFLAIAVLFISVMGAFFRMNLFSLTILNVIFFLLFIQIINSPLIIISFILVGLAIGFMISNAIGQ